VIPKHIKLHTYFNALKPIIKELTPKFNIVRLASLTNKELVSMIIEAIRILRLMLEIYFSMALKHETTSINHPSDSKPSDNNMHMTDHSIVFHNDQTGGEDLEREKMSPLSRAA